MKNIIISLRKSKHKIIHTPNTEGFYSKEHLMRAGKFVIGPGFELRKEHKDKHSYPVNGWHWFDSVEEAAEYFRVNKDDFNLDLPKDT